MHRDDAHPFVVSIPSEVFAYDTMCKGHTSVSCLFQATVRRDTSVLRRDAPQTQVEVRLARGRCMRLVASPCYALESTENVGRSSALVVGGGFKLKLRADESRAQVEVHA